jgi:protein TonB
VDYAQYQRNPSKHAPAIAMVVALHLLLGYALVTGLARKVVEVMKAPIETKIIEEIKKPPPDVPPPPPPKLAPPPPPFIPAPEINIQAPVQIAPTITAAPAVTPPAPVAAPPVAAPPAPPQPAIRKEYKASFRVEPTYPRQAISAGLTGKVIAWVRVAPNGSVTDVQIRESSNRIFDREVIRALSQWKFNPEPVGFIGEYEIVFNLKD